MLAALGKIPISSTVCFMFDSGLHSKLTPTLCHTLPSQDYTSRLSSQNYQGLSLSGKHLALLKHLLISSDTAEAKHGTFLGPGGEKGLIWLRTEGHRGPGSG